MCGLSAPPSYKVFKKPNWNRVKLYDFINLLSGWSSCCLRQHVASSIRSEYASLTSSNKSETRKAVWCYL